MNDHLPGAISAGSHSLTVEQTALHVGLSASHLNKLRVYGGGPAFHKIGRRVVYRPMDIEQWLSSRRFANTSEAQAA